MTSRISLVVFLMLGAAALVPARADDPAAAKPQAKGDASQQKKDRDEKDKEQDAKTSQERIEKIKKLSFDRRPSVLLGGVVRLDPNNENGEEKADDKKSETESKDPFDAQLQAFRRSVERGRWDEVGAFLKALADKDQAAAVDHLLEGLTKAPPPQPGPNGQPLPPEKPVFTAADVVGLARALPGKLDEKRQKQVAAVARLALDGGADPADLAAALVAETTREQAAIDRGAAGMILAEAGRADLADALAPTVSEAVMAGDFAGLKLRVRQLRAARARDAKTVPIDDLWAAAQGLVAIKTERAEDRRYAIAQAIDLLPELPKATAAEWMAKVTADDPAAGREMLAAIAARVAAGLQQAPRDVAGRTRWLDLLDRAVAGVTATKAAQDSSWREPLTLAARAWTAEAIHSATHDQRDIGMRRDPYGNIYYWEEQQLEQERQQLPQWPVKLADAIDARPGEAWLALLDPAERPAVEKAVIRLRCKAGEPEKALPLLERLAASHPAAARELVPAMLDAWKLAHNPNDERSRRMPFFWYFGMEERQTGIPLSRSLQQRNLAELAGFVKRLRVLPLGNDAAKDGAPEWIDEKLLVDCFTTCHSVAEVYSPESIAAVFGPIEKLSPTAVARLAGKMRSNLAGTWQKPSVQEQAKTKRKEADIRAEVLKGYGTAREFLAQAFVRHPGHWALLGAQAALAHDENDYHKKIVDTPDYTKNRRAALDAFAAAVEAYARATAMLPRNEWQADLIETWFLAGCGACDAGRIDETTSAVPGESGRIRVVIESMGPEPREWHTEQFAAALVARLSKLNPAVKHRVVREGLVVAGDHPTARDARKVFDYYTDLIREIELRADIDGPDRVGSGKPFGVLVSLRHTREIEREAGGFSRYLQNQKTGNMFMFNFGRPLANYREKFEEAARKALGEFFEIKSVTFEAENVQSRSDAEYGWRRTPYAYLVLVAKDPKVDRLPPLRMDLDFLDTSGFVILPIESRATALDASADAGEPRPYAKLALTQILDDRKAREAEVTLEVRAAARGLVPDLDTLVDTNLDGFTVKNVRDDGLSVSRFDPESSEPVVLSERSWAMTLEPEGRGAAGRFTFPKPKGEVAESVLQRYDDADLVSAARTVEIGSPITQRMPRWQVIAGGAAAGIAALAFLAALGWALAHPTPVPAPPYSVPEPATPFAVLQLLRDIQSSNGLDARGHAELAESIDRLERAHFANQEPDLDLDLATVARSWVLRAHRRSR